MSRMDEVVAKNRDDYPEKPGDGQTEPLFWWVEVQLVGGDGNAFAIIGAVARELRRAGLNEEAKAYAADAMDSGSYDELLQHALRTVDVT